MWMMIQQRLDNAGINGKNVLKNFLLAMDIDDPTRKRALLLHYIGSSAFDVFETLSDTGDEKDYKTSTLPDSAMLNMKSICFVKLVNNRKKH